MAIFDPSRQGQTQPNALFQALNERIRKEQEVRQVQRQQDTLKTLRGQGLLGVQSQDLFNPDTGKLDLSSGNAMSVSEHYKALSTQLGEKGLKKVFGRTATADDVKEFIRGESKKRDLKVLNALDLRMKELGTENIYKVIKKGDASFEDWYNSTDQETKLKLLEAGYNPKLKEGFGTLAMERRRAQGKSAIPGTALLGGAGVLAGGAYFGRNKISNLAKSYTGRNIKQLQYGLGQMARDIDAGKLSSEEAQRIIKEMRQNSSKAGKSILDKIPKSLKDPKQLIMSIGRQAPILGAYSPGEAVGEKIAKEIGLGELGQGVGGLAGGTASATAMAKALPNILTKVGKAIPISTGPKGAIAKGVITGLGLGSGALLDYLLND